MTLLLHILPEDGLGGAEIAARRAAEAEPGRLAVLALAGRPAGGALVNLSSLGAIHPFSPLAAWRAAGRARAFPVAAFSLWKSALAMLACAIRAPRTRRVLFLHSDRRVHLADTLATWLGTRLAHEIWSDSAGSLSGLGRLAPDGVPGRVISFVIERPRPVRRTRPRPRFIFWGRLNGLKRIERAVALFADLAADRPEARFTLIGPDAGSEAALRAQVRRLGLEEKVAFTGALDFPGIVARAAEHDIFLQLSEQEGAAMSLIEAMQLGLVPVVTPVGEMPAYVRQGETGIVYVDHNQAANDIRRMLDDPALFAQLSAAAIDEWTGRGLYQDEVVAAAEALAQNNRGDAPCAA